SPIGVPSGQRARALQRVPPPSTPTRINWPALAIDPDISPASSRNARLQAAGGPDPDADIDNTKLNPVGKAEYHFRPWYPGSYGSKNKAFMIMYLN
ncbi:MAG TPA: hypothetical protein VGN75_08110, partial [Kaistia sp.]|nr:hypothetical protein [Kaistia sp.]